MCPTVEDDSEFNAKLLNRLYDHPRFLTFFGSAVVCLPITDRRILDSL